jgi:hypothetical protein
MFALEAVRAVFGKFALDDVVAELDVIAPILSKTGAVQKFRIIEGTYAIERILHMTAATEHVDAIFRVVGEKVAIETVLALIQIVAD